VIPHEEEDKIKIKDDIKMRRKDKRESPSKMIVSHLEEGPPQ
jgi:hypothetical protein